MCARQMEIWSSDTHLGNETLFNYEITNIEGTVATPTETDKSFASDFVNKPILD